MADDEKATAQNETDKKKPAELLPMRVILADVTFDYEDGEWTRVPPNDQ